MEINCKFDKTLSAPVEITRTEDIGFVLMPAAAYFEDRFFISGNTSSQLLIGKNPKVCGGAPIILGTRISVHHIITQMRTLGWNRERILISYPHLSLMQIDAALGYYNSHQQEIDDLIAAEEFKNSEWQQHCI